MKDLIQSIRARLLNIAKQQGDDYNTLLVQYALQRLLYRLSISEYADQFLLKGSWLFVVWNNSLHRPTRDIDLLGYGSNDVDKLLTVFKVIAETKVEQPDGLVFDTALFKSAEIKKEGDYQGVRISGKAKLGNAIIPLQIDIGFGDVVTPAAVQADLPSWLDFPKPNLRMYPVYTVVAEKFHAMIYLGLTNSRMKDFYDVVTIAQILPEKMTLHFDELQQAITATFARRGLDTSDKNLMIFSDSFKNDDSKAKQWLAFKNKNGLKSTDDFSNTVAKIQQFLEPVYQHIALNEPKNNQPRKSQQWNNTIWRWE